MNDYYSVPRAASVLGKSFRVVDLAIREGYVTPIGDGRARLLTTTDIDRLRQVFAERDARKQGKKSR